MVDPVTTGIAISATQLALQALELLRKPKPDVSEAAKLITQLQQSVSQLEQTLHQLRAENLDFKDENHRVRLELDSKEA